RSGQRPREQDTSLLEQLAQGCHVMRNRDLPWHVRHPPWDVGDVRVRLKTDPTDVMDVVRRIDAPTREDVCATQKRDAVAAPYQKHLERVLAPEKDDGGCRNGCGDAHRFVLYRDGEELNSVSHEDLRRSSTAAPDQRSGTRPRSGSCFLSS